MQWVETRERTQHRWPSRIFSLGCNFGQDQATKKENPNTPPVQVFHHHVCYPCLIDHSLRHPPPVGSPGVPSGMDGWMHGWNIDRYTVLNVQITCLYITDTYIYIHIYIYIIIYVYICIYIYRICMDMWFVVAAPTLHPTFTSPVGTPGQLRKRYPIRHEKLLQAVHHLRRGLTMTWFGDITRGLPSGYVKIAIENDHRNR